jgi:hypothetical protein
MPTYIVKNSLQEILVTDIFLVDVRKILRIHESNGQISTKNWPDDLGDEIKGKIALRGEFWMGSIGLEGFLSLMVPLRDKKQKKSEVSWDENLFDNWRFLSCLCVPAENDEIEFWFSMSSATDFYRGQDVVCRLTNVQLGDEASLITTYFLPDCSPVCVAWQAAWKVFQREFDALIPAI